MPPYFRNGVYTMNNTEKLLKMKDNLAKLQSKRTIFSNKINETDEKIKQQQSEINGFIEKTKTEMLKSLAGEDLSFEDLQVLETASSEISSIFKMLLSTKNVSVLANRICEFCKTVQDDEIEEVFINETDEKEQ